MICNECGKDVGINEKHTFSDCLKYKNQIICPRCHGYGVVDKSSEKAKKGSSK